MLDLHDKIKVLQKVTDRSNANLALNHIFVDDRYMVATDEWIMLAFPLLFDNEQSMLIVNPKAKTPLIVEGDWHGIAVNYATTEHYLDYKRIINRAKAFTQVKGRWSLLDFLYRLSHTKGWMMDYVKRATLLRNLDSKLGEISAYCYKGNTDVLFLRFDEEAILAIAPLTVYADVDFSEL